MLFLSLMTVRFNITIVISNITIKFELFLDRLIVGLWESVRPGVVQIIEHETIQKML